MQKPLDVKQSVHALCTAYPELISVLQQLGFTDISKPGMLKTAGRFMTLEKGAAMKGIAWDRVLQTLEEHGFTINNRKEQTMSEKINNSEYRKNVIADMIRQLHEGKSVEQVKAQFEAAFSNVSASEISQAEQALIAGGMPVAEVQRLCDVHAAVFKGSIDEIHRAPQETAGEERVLDTLNRENRALEELLAQRVKPAIHTYHAGDGAQARQTLAAALRTLAGIDLHYSKKENLLFPLLEKHGITAPPKVMWGVDDEIRAAIKAALATLERGDDPLNTAALEDALVKMEEMIFKEENILFPMLWESLTHEEWALAAHGEAEIGYFLIAPPQAPADDAPEAQPLPAAERIVGEIRLPSGVFSVDALTHMLNALPFDITYVGADDTVRYFSEGRERAFARTRSIIGRSVINCHPPASMHVVQQILDDFRAGKKEHEDFWIRMGERYLLIRYFAVRDETGAHIGTLEVTQDIAPIQAIEGEKRLLT